MFGRDNKKLSTETQKPFPWKVEAKALNQTYMRIYKNYTNKWGKQVVLYHKILLVMRLTTVILIATLMQVSAAGMAQKITMQQKQASLKEIFTQINLQTGYDVVWKSEHLKNTKAIAVNFKNKDVTAVLDEILPDQNLIYTIEDKTVVIKEAAPSFLNRIVRAFSTVDIRGKIVGEDGAAISGATVSVKGTGKSVISDEDGAFYMAGINENAILVISYVGYVTKEVTAAAAMGDVTLTLSEGKLEEVEINAGYYTVTDRARTGSIERVAAAEIGRQPVGNPLAAIQGRVAGLVITQNSGINGAGFKVQLRGQGSLMQGSDPLFIIDGVPLASGNSSINTVSNATGSSGISPFSTINPADIESVEVLKDADATAIYGSRGANGVILITTKKGTASSPSLSLNVYSGYGKTTRTMDMLNTAQYIEMRKEAFKNDGVAMTNSSAPDLLLWDQERYTDFKKLLIGGRASTTDAQMSLNGGSAQTRYVLSGGYHRESSVFPGTQSDNRASVRANVNHRSSDTRFSLDFVANYTIDKNIQGAGDLTSLINMPPNMLLYTAEGKLNWQEGGAFFGGAITNPLASSNRVYTGNFQHLNSNAMLGYQVFKGLKLKSSFGYNNINSKDQAVNPSTSINPNSGTLPYATFGRSSIDSWIIEPQADYSGKLAKGSLQVLVGGTFQGISSNSLNVLAQNYKNDILLSSIAAAGNSTTSNADFRYNYTAIYGRINYNLKERYFINLTGRRDGSSRFGPGNRFANFGAIGAAWIFSDEPGLDQALPFLSFGKLRGSFGLTGNDQIGNYKYLDSWTNSSLPYQGVAGLQPVSLFNGNYAWETNSKAEVAIELGFLKDRIRLTTSYYRNRSGNQLVNYKLPIQTGFNSILRNLDAVIENSGLEILLATKNVVGRDFSWTSSLNFSVPKNKLVRFPDLETSTYASTYLIGEPLSVRRLFEYKGVDPATGIYQFNDVNGDGLYDSADRTILKNTQPDFLGGLQNSFSFKGLQLDVFLEFRKQLGLNYLNTQSTFIPGYFYFNHPAVVMERWQSAGNETRIQRFVASGSSPAYAAAGNYLSGSDAVFSDASFIRVKNVSLSYHFCKDWTRKLHLNNLSVFVQGQNLFTLTKYEGSDPENQSIYILPPLRVLTAGIQLTL